MAYAPIAGLPVEVGLYTAIVPLLAYSLVGTSRPLSVSTTSTIAALTAVAVSAANPQDNHDAFRAVATLAVLTAVILRGRRVQARLPRRLHLAAGAGRLQGRHRLLIISGQLGKVLGIEQLLAGLTIALLLAVKQWAPRAFAGALVAVVFGIVLSRVLDLEAKGVDVVGPVPAGLPSLELPLSDCSRRFFPPRPASR